MSYLMDDIAAGAHEVRRVFGKDRDPILRVYPMLDDKLRGIPRFLFDDDAIHAAVELTLGRPKVLLEALEHVSIPYPRMWIEWAESGRAKLRDTFEAGGSTIESPDRPLPQRLGFLIESDDGRRGTVTWVWNAHTSRMPNDEPFPNVAAVEPHFDLDAQIPQSRERIESFLKGNLCRLWGDNPVQLEALFGLWRTAEHKPSAWGYHYLEAMAARRGVDKLPEIIAHCMADTYGEYIIIWACILLLTASRKAVEHRPVDRAKLNKARAQKRLPLLWDHTEVVMHISQPAVGTGATRAPLDYHRKPPRIHMVSRYLARRGEKHWIVESYMRGSGKVISRHVQVRK